MPARRLPPRRGRGKRDTRGRSGTRTRRAIGRPGPPGAGEAHGARYPAPPTSSRSREGRGPREGPVPDLPQTHGVVLPAASRYPAAETVSRHRGADSSSWHDPHTPPPPPARCGVTLERHRPAPPGPRSTCSTVFQLAPPSTAPKEAPPPARADATSTEVGGTRNRRPKRGNRGTAAGAGETREPRARVFHARPSHGGSKGTPWAGRPRGGRSRVPVSPALPRRGSATGRSVWRWVVVTSIHTSNAWWLFFR